MKLRDWPLEPGGDADIPEQFRGNQEMVLFEIRSVAQGKLQQYVTVADGKMDEHPLRNEVGIRSMAQGLMEKSGVAGEIGNVVLLKGMSREATDFVYEALRFVVGPAQERQHVVPMTQTLNRETIIGLLRSSTRKSRKK